MLGLPPGRRGSPEDLELGGATALPGVVQHSLLKVKDSAGRRQHQLYCPILLPPQACPQPGKRLMEPESGAAWAPAFALPLLSSVCLLLCLGEEERGPSLISAYPLSLSQPDSLPQGVGGGCPAQPGLTPPVNCLLEA
jgi:hypothetical protein